MARQRRMIRRRTRRRRAPEVARQELLDAAERVFAGAHPDRVGLKEIAHEAGVSHALVTHYFGTYAGLIEATLERRVRRLRETILDKLRQSGALLQPIELLGVLFRALEDPVHLRLMKWVFASERPASAYALALQEQGLKQVARQVGDAVGLPDGSPKLDTIERTLATAVAAAFGWAFSRHTIAGALGRTASTQLDDEIQGTLAGMVQTYLRANLGAAIPV